MWSAPRAKTWNNRKHNLEDVMKNLRAQLRFVSILFLILSAWMTMTTATVAYAQITPLGDSYTDTADSTTNYGAKTLLDVDGATQIAYIQFDLASIPATASISQATLKLYVNTVTTAGSFNVDYVNGAWTEGTIDASNAPALGSTIASGVSITTADKNQYILINVTSAVQAWLSGSETNNGIALVANSTFNATFDSKENTTTSHPPELDIAFAGGDGTITGVTTASGSGLTGGGTSGTLNLGLLTSCSSGQVLEWNGSAWACATTSGTGTITGVTAGTDLTGGGASGNVTLNLNTANLNLAYAQLSAANTFAPQQVIKGNGGNAIIGDPGCGSGFSGIALTSSTLSGCSNYTMIGKSSGDVYVNSTSSGYIHFRNGNSGSNTFNDLATIDNKGNLTAAGKVVGTASVSGFSGYVGVFGESDGASTEGAFVAVSGAGVWGDTGGSADSSYYGVLGSADDNNAGAFFNSAQYDGVFSGDTATIYAENDDTSGTGYVLVTSNSDQSSHCKISVTADLTCTGTKSAVVPVDGGSRKVALYAIEGPENWFEDAGSTQLSNGVAVVNLEPVFGQTVNTGMDYHVFLTPNGDCKGLYVSQKTPTSFEVRELGGGTSSIAFDYRIMAKRKGYESIRLADKTEQFGEQSMQRRKMRRRVQPSAAPQAGPVTPMPPFRASSNAEETQPR
jgi:hypothetical protein